MTPPLWIHDMPKRAKESESACVAALVGSGNSDLVELARTLDGTKEEPINLVFTGQYNAGKSTLVRALTGKDDILIDSDVATTEVRSYSWGEVVLTDTPGVQAGLREHDALAERALRDSDLVVFVLSVDLLDDAGAAHLRHVAIDLRKQWSVAVVINKAGSMHADPAIRLAAVRHELGALADQIPIVITDARDYLDGLAETDPELREELLTTGNVAGLSDALNSLVRRAGQESRLRRPFEKVIAVSAEAMEGLADDPREAAARNVLNRERRMVTASRRRLELAIDARFQDFRRSIVRLGEDLADGVDYADALEGAQRDQRLQSLDDEFRAAVTVQREKIVQALRQEVDHEARIAAQEFQELKAGAALEVLDGFGFSPEPESGAEGAQHAQQRKPRDYDRVLKSISSGAGEFGSWWGTGTAKGLSGVKGTQGHKVIYTVGKKLGHNFKPWEAVKWAKGVGDAARFVSKAAPFISMGLEVYSALQADAAEGEHLKELQQRRRRTIQQADAAGAEDESDLRAEADLALAEFYGPVLAAIESQQADLDAVVDTRSGTRGDLAKIVAECSAILSTLEPQTA